MNDEVYLVIELFSFFDSNDSIFPQSFVRAKFIKMAKNQRVDFKALHNLC